MKTKNSFLLILCLLLFSSLHAQNDPVKILAIGNSFADDGIEYLDEIAISAGKHIIVANTYICLLYTSPSPRDRSVSRMPSSA